MGGAARLGVLKVSVHRFSSAAFIDVRNYRRLVGDEMIEEISDLARALHGIRVCHVNSTGFGGGVARAPRHVPLANALGIHTDWRIIQGTPEFFTVTKALHNALQGAAYKLSEADKAIYLHVNRESARLLDARYDVIVVHDPQPAAILALHGKGEARWIWRCHIDTASPNPDVWEFLRSHLEGYDAAIFTMREFLPPDLPIARVDIAPPRSIRSRRRTSTSASKPRGRCSPGSESSSTVRSSRRSRASTAGRTRWA